jgi:hypothetical protein
MSFTVEDIIRLRDGWRGPITVGELPPSVAKAIGLSVPLVYLSQESLGHINRDHSDIADHDLLIAPFVLKHGLFLREVRKKKNPQQEAYLASYVGEHSPKRMGLSFKVTQTDRVVYMTSFYRVKPRQMKAWFKRCEIIKPHA